MAKINKRTILIATGIAALVGVTVFFLRRRRKNTKKIQMLNDILDGKVQDPNNPVGIESYWTPLYAAKYSKNPAFWADPKITKYVNDMAKMIYDGVGYFYDSPEKALTAIKQTDSKVGISKLSGAFSTRYGKDMLNYLETGLSNTDAQKKILTQIKQHTDILPSVHPWQ